MSRRRLLDAVVPRPTPAKATLTPTQRTLQRELHAQVDEIVQRSISKGRETKAWHRIVLDVMNAADAAKLKRHA